MTDVLELLRARGRDGSTPGRRNDDARLVLLVEGGSSRGAFSSGMTVAVEELGLLPLFDAVYGSSAGALNAAWLLCGRAGSTMHAWWTPSIMRATIDPWRALRRRPVVDTQFLVTTVYTEIMPMGFQEILDSPVEFHPIATDARTGRSADLHHHLRNRAGLQAAFRASTAMPLLTGEPVEIDGRRYVDAGVSEAIPVRTALAQGATHLVALRTRRADERVSLPRRTTSAHALVHPPCPGRPRALAPTRGRTRRGGRAPARTPRSPRNPSAARQRKRRPHRDAPRRPARRRPHRPTSSTQSPDRMRCDWASTIVGCSVDAELRDGAHVLLRPMRPDDKALVREAFDRMSLETRRQRFFLPVRELSEALLVSLTELDHVDRFAWVALIRERGRESIAGVARYGRLRDDPTVAEPALVVVDAYQGRGIGRLLLEALVLEALAVGVTRFQGEILCDNLTVRTVLTHAGARMSRGEPGTVQFSLVLPPLAEALHDHPVRRALAQLRRRYDWESPGRAE